MVTLSLYVTTRGTTFDSIRREEVAETFQGKVKLTYGSLTLREMEDAEQAITLLFEISRDVAISLFASWLYDKLREREDASATLNGTPVQDKETIEAILRTVFESRLEPDQS
jgi:hypothetical protein